jgi:hypothetical protein
VLLGHGRFVPVGLLTRLGIGLGLYSVYADTRVTSGGGCPLELFDNATRLHSMGTCTGLSMLRWTSLTLTLTLTNKLTLTLTLTLIHPH